MCYLSQKGFWGIFFGITQNQKGYLVYITITWKIVSSHGVVFDETFYSALACTSRLYSEALDTRPALLCIPYVVEYRVFYRTIVLYD